MTQQAELGKGVGGGGVGEEKYSNHIIEETSQQSNQSFPHSIALAPIFTMTKQFFLVQAICNVSKLQK